MVRVLTIAAMAVSAVVVSAIFSVPAAAVPPVVDQYTEQVPTAGGPQAGSPELDGAAKKPEGSKRRGTAKGESGSADGSGNPGSADGSGDPAEPTGEKGGRLDEPGNSGSAALPDEGADDDGADPQGVVAQGANETEPQVSSLGYGMGLLFPLILVLVAGIVVALVIGRGHSGTTDLKR